MAGGAFALGIAFTSVWYPKHWQGRALGIFGAGNAASQDEGATPGGANNPLAGALALTVLGNNYLLDLELSAIQTEGRGEVVANPRVITANQQEAVIKQGDEIGYVTVSAATAGAAPQVQIEFKEVVLELRVTPTITQDNRVFLNMSVKKDEVSGFTETPLYRVPNITKRELNTAVLVENGQTVVLGGV